MVVFMYCLLTNPLLILCFIFSGGLWVFITMIRKIPLKVMGREITQSQLLYFLFTLTGLALIFTSGYRTLIWSLIFSSIINISHAVFRAPDYTSLPTSAHEAMEMDIRQEVEEDMGMSSLGPGTGIEMDEMDGLGGSGLTGDAPDLTEISIAPDPPMVASAAI